MSRTGPPHHNECAQLLAKFKKRLLERPKDNNIGFWTGFVAGFFTQDAKKRWCTSHYVKNDDKSLGGHQDTWNCELCERSPGYGYEITFRAMPKLFKAKYDSGISEELLHTDRELPREQYDVESGYTVLLYGGTIKAGVYEQGRVVHEGKLRITFSKDVKIFSWEFCSRGHEVLIPLSIIQNQICEFAAGMKEFIASNKNASSNQSVQDLQMSANKFVEAASRLEKALEIPELTCVGYKQSYVRCLQDTFHEVYCTRFDEHHPFLSTKHATKFTCLFSNIKCGQV